MKKEIGTTKLDPPLKVLSFHKNEHEEVDFGDFLYDLTNSDREDDQQILNAKKGFIVAYNEETDMLMMRQFFLENQAMVFFMEKIKLNIMLNGELE
jgi:hypothetical protein